MMTTRPRVVVSWSTGKDAAWTLHELRQAGEFYTFVSGVPRFAHPLAVESGVVTEREGCRYADLVSRTPVRAGA